MTTPPQGQNPFAPGQQPYGQPQGQAPYPPQGTAPYPPQGGYPQQPGQPGFPQYATAPYAPIPPQRPKRGIKQYLRIGVVIVALIAAGVGWFASRHDPDTDRENQLARPNGDAIDKAFAERSRSTYDVFLTG